METCENAVRNPGHHDRARELLRRKGTGYFSKSRLRDSGPEKKDKVTIIKLGVYLPEKPPRILRPGQN